MSTLSRRNNLGRGSSSCLSFGQVGSKEYILQAMRSTGLGKAHTTNSQVRKNGACGGSYLGKTQPLPSRDEVDDLRVARIIMSLIPGLTLSSLKVYYLRMTGWPG